MSNISLVLFGHCRTRLGAYGELVNHFSPPTLRGAPAAISAHAAWCESWALVFLRRVTILGF